MGSGTMLECSGCHEYSLPGVGRCEKPPAKGFGFRGSRIEMCADLGFGSLGFRRFGFRDLGFNGLGASWGLKLVPLEKNGLGLRVV